MNRTDATTAVKQAALNIGFDAVGIAEAMPLFGPMERYNEWLRRGYHGMLGYMERNNDVRENPDLLVPGARSVVVVAKNYYTPFEHKEEDVGKISRYAWGTDYHNVIPPMLDQLILTLKQMDPECISRRFTDTGPLLEKEWAVRSGIAWQGKHSNVLRRDIGSWFFLGVVVTTLDLIPDAPIADYCGTCTACMDACPTHAIVEPNLVDATQCISYWTIEVKPQHEIPQHIAEHMDGWLFGCDVCQEVCPWNRFQTPSSDPHFQPRNNVTSLPLESVVNLQQKEFKEMFRDSPLTRPKLEGLKRNARALQNRGDAQTEEENEHNT